MGEIAGKCIVCSKELEKGLEDDLADPSTNIQPSGGIHVITNGNYGSTVLDGDCIVFHVCDKCLEKAMKDGVAREYKPMDYRQAYRDLKSKVEARCKLCDLVGNGVCENTSDATTIYVTVDGNDGGEDGT